MVNEPRSILWRFLCYTEEVLYKDRFHIVVRDKLYPLRIFELCDYVVCPVSHGGFVKEFCIPFSLSNPLYLIFVSRKFPLASIALPIHPSKSQLAFAAPR